MTHGSGKAIQIIAGPGAGKTTKLIELISNALEVGPVADSAIIACTFTRKAAEELVQRIEQNIGPKYAHGEKLLIGTIHSICLDVLREFVPQDFSDWDVLSEESQVPYIHSKLATFGFDEEETRGQSSWDLAREISQIFTTVTDENIDVERILNNIESGETKGLGNDVSDQIHRVLDNYELYKAALTEDKLFDFATIQRTFLDLIVSDLEIAHRIVEKYATIFVDEYQDVNDVQNEIFLRLCELGASLTVVGDDDQSIYGFRGGKVEHLVEFTKRVSAIGAEVDIIRLETNFRSTQRIVSATNAFIESQNYARLSKTLTAHRKVDGPDVRAIQFSSDHEEANWIVDEIVRLRTSGTITSFRSVGVLFTSVKNHASTLLKLLRNRGIPVQASGSGTLFDEPFVEEFMGLLEYWLARAEARCEREANLVRSLSESRQAEYRISNYFDNLYQLVDSRRFYSSCLALMYDIFEATNFVTRYQNHGVNLGNLTTLVHTFDKFSGKYNPYGLYSYLAFVRKQQNIDYVDDQSRDAVQILTVHRSKGLQFDVVFVASQNDRNQPSADLFDDFSMLAGRHVHNLEESKRVLYVAMTRARNFLAISSSTSLENRKKRYTWNQASLDAVRSGIRNSDLSIVHLNNSEFTDFSAQSGLNPVLSYNAIRLYDICPLQFKFSHVDRLETVRIGGMQFGVNMHRIVEQLLRMRQAERTVSDGTIGRLIELFWRDLPTRPNDENVKFRETGEKQLRMFVSKYLAGLSPESIGGIEQPFSLTIADTRIVGRLDLRLRTGGVDEIVDFKTGDPDDYRDQLNFYAACWSRMTGVDIKRVALYYLKSGTLEVFEPEATDEQVDRVGNVANRINAGNFHATPGRHCGDCAYSAICEFSTTKKRRKLVN